MVEDSQQESVIVTFEQRLFDIMLGLMLEIVILALAFSVSVRAIAKKLS